MKELSAAGIPVGVGIAPIIPGLNDRQIPEILERAHDAGAQSAFMTLLRLPAEVKDVFLESLKSNLPTHSDKVIGRLKELRGGEIYRPEFGARMRGEGPLWEAIQFLFRSNCERLGLNKERERRRPKTFKRPQRQLGLF
jgi:DNA repair photolyase